MARRSSIEWCDHTWNPVTGCAHGCDYCYARTMTNRFSGDIRANLSRVKEYEVDVTQEGNLHFLYRLNEPMTDETGKNIIYPFGFRPTLHKYRMDELKGMTGKNVFVGAMTDLFGDWVPDEWILDVMQACKENYRHNYLFLTKNPKRYKDFAVKQDNFWYGTTITCHEDLSRLADLPNYTNGFNTFVSIEPLLGRIFETDAERQWFQEAVDWVIIGAETGRRKNKVEPDARWIADITRICAEAGIPVFMKDSMAKVMGGAHTLRREFPYWLAEKKLTKKMEDKLFDRCCICNGENMKSEMINLSARSQRGEYAKSFAYMHKKCFAEFCTEHGLEIPNLKGISSIEEEEQQPIHE